MAEIIDKYKIPEGSLISFFSNKVKQNGGVNLAQGIPGFQPPQELIEILQDIAAKEYHQYAPGNGNLNLLNILNKKYQYYGLRKDNLLVVQGVTEAITLLYIYLKQIIKDELTAMAFDPVYETYSNIPKIFGDQFISFPVEENIDFQLFEKEIIKSKIKLLFLSSPGNPLGRIYTKKEIDRIIELSAKYDFYIIFDAVYQDLYFKNPPYIPLDQFNDRLFYVSSFSKMLSITGWRIGYLLASDVHIDKIKAIHDYTGLCAPSILQEALSTYLEIEYFGEKYIKGLQEKLTKSFNLLTKELIKLGFEIPRIDGGYFIWAKLPEKFKNGFEFAMDLYEKEKLAVIPGVHFSELAKNYIRFNIAHEIEIIEEGIDKLKNFTKNA